MKKEYQPVVATYRCGCCIEGLFLERQPRCYIHDEPHVMQGSDKDWKSRKTRNKRDTATVYLSHMNYFTERVDLDMRFVIIENPNVLVKRYLLENAQTLHIIDRNTKPSYIEEVLASDYSLYLNCSIGAVYKNLRGMIHTSFLSTYRFITDVNYRQVVTGEQPKPRGQLFK